MTPRALAVILASADLQKLYTGLSLLVCAAAEGRSARGLVTFGALGVLVDDELERRALQPHGTPQLTREGRRIFARSLAELRDTVADLEHCRLEACSAAVQTTGVAPGDVARRLDGVTSTPRFLREVAGAELVVV
jgi:peroxiredoxin family protein